MPYWQVYNGWRGNGDVRALVEAVDECAAEEAALAVFRAEADRMRNRPPLARTNYESFVQVERIERVELPLLLEE